MKSLLLVALFASAPAFVQPAGAKQDCANVFGQSMAACTRNAATLRPGDRDAANKACSDGAMAAKLACEAGPAPVPLIAMTAKSGQVTSYAAGDDGAVQAGLPSPTPRFIDNGDGTVVDALTALMWTKDGSPYFIHWEDALNYCNQYPAGVPSGWRMPNIRELMSLMDFEQRAPMLPAGNPFTNVPTDIGNFYYWTSTTNSVYDTKHDAYGVNLASGEVRIWNKGSGGFLLCVKNK